MNYFTPCAFTLHANNQEEMKYDTTTKTFTDTNLVEYGPNDENINFKIHFANNIAKNAHACYSPTSGQVPMSNCSNTGSSNLAVLANAMFNPSNREITITKLAIITRDIKKHEVGTIRENDILLSPINN